MGLNSKTDPSEPALLLEHRSSDVHLGRNHLCLFLRCFPLHLEKHLALRAPHHFHLLASPRWRLQMAMEGLVDRSILIHFRERRNALLHGPALGPETVHRRCCISSVVYPSPRALFLLLWKHFSARIRNVR